jgi:hypothetical protein
MTASLVLVRQKGVLPFLIRLVTFSRWNHVAILDKSAAVVWDFDRPGARIVSLSEYSSSVHDLKVVPGMEVRSTPIENLMKYRGCKYSDLRNVAVVLPFLRRFARGENCVSWCMLVLFDSREYQWKTPGWFA